MQAHFPPHAESCIILGGDRYLNDQTEVPKHWDLRRFGSTEVASFLSEIDFLVYFTHPRWCESFGRAIAEGIAAGKVVITDPETADTFGHAVVASDGSDIDAIVAGFVRQPGRYVDFVRNAQNTLARFGPDTFLAQALARIEAAEASSHALV